MRIVRYQDHAGIVGYGLLAADGTVEAAAGDPFSGLRPLGIPALVQRLRAPIAPVQILGVGLNYRRHALEAGMAVPQHPVLFVKGINTVQDPGQPIRLPTALASHEVDYECELAVVIGRDARNVSSANALDHVLGYTCANDVSARDWQLRLGGGQWCRGKFFDTFCPLGPCLVTADEIRDPQGLGIRTLLNGVTVQYSTTADMIFPVAELISFLSGSTTLPAGTVILTGTPPGVGMAHKPPRWLRPGDVATIEIDGIGALSNPVELERP